MFKQIARGGALMIVCLWALQAGLAQETKPSEQRLPEIAVRGLSPQDEKIFAGLEEDTRMEFVETPLIDVVDYLKELHALEIVIDEKAIEGSRDRIVTANHSGNSLRNSLTLLLRNIDADWIVERGTIVVTSKERAATALSTRTYELSPLVSKADDPAELQALVTLAKEVLRREAAPAAAAPGGVAPGEAVPVAEHALPRSVSQFETLLIVRDDRAAHEELYGVLTALLERKHPEIVAARVKQEQMRLERARIQERQARPVQPPLPVPEERDPFEAPKPERAPPADPFAPGAAQPDPFAPPRQALLKDEFVPHPPSKPPVDPFGPFESPAPKK